MSTRDTDGRRYSPWHGVNRVRVNMDALILEVSKDYWTFKFGKLLGIIGREFLHRLRSSISRESWVSHKKFVNMERFSRKDLRVYYEMGSKGKIIVANPPWGGL